VSRIEQSGRMLLRRPKPPIKGGSVPEEEEEEEEITLSHFPFNAHWLSVFYHAYSQFLMGISFLTYTHSSRNPTTV